MLFNKPVSNPMLAGAIELMVTEPTPEHKRTFLEEILKSELLCPAFINPPPEIDESGIPRLGDNTKVQIPTLYTPEGVQYFLAFTDKEELYKWKSEEECPYTYACSFDDFVMLLRHREPDGTPGPAQGVVINPCGCNYVLDKDKVANILLTRELSMMEREEKNN